MKYVNSKRLNNSAAAAMTTLAIANGATVLSEIINVQANIGFFVLTLKEDKVGGGGNIAVYATYSDDGVNFNRPYTSDLAGTITQEGNVVTALGNVTRRIIHTARLAKYMQYAFVASADSQLTADLAFQEEDQ